MDLRSAGNTTRCSLVALLPLTHSLCEDMCVILGTGYEVPRCRLAEEQIYVDVDSSVEIQCIASGTPRPRVEWTGPRGARLSPHVVIDDGLLRIPRVREDDEGEYVCTASNSAGQCDATARLVVRAREFTNCMAFYTSASN